MNSKHDIAAIAREGIAQISDEPLYTALTSVLDGRMWQTANASAVRCIDRLCSRRWPTETLARFLRGWGDLHQTALFVSGLMVRILRLAPSIPENRCAFLYVSAREMGEIIPEDIGLHGKPHYELFAEFATGLIGDDRWRLEKYTLPECRRFRDFVRRSRLNEPIEMAILTTAASENWNSGEYTYLNGRVRPWLEMANDITTAEIEDVVRYVAVHAGETESGHFLHAINAWKSYCNATNLPADPTLAAQMFNRYSEFLVLAFSELEELFS